MLVKLFTLAFDPTVNGFNDDKVREFLRDKEILSIRDHYFERNEIPYLTLIVRYFPYRPEAEPGSSSKKQTDNSWQKLINEEDYGLFNILRDWRSEKSKKEGMPPYILFTNKQLAHITKLRPQSLADLIKIDGIGQKKAERYGQEILNITKIDTGEKPEGQAE